MIQKIAAISMILLLFILRSASSGEMKWKEDLCQEEGFRCLKIEKGSTWETLFKDEEQRDLVRRLNRMNIRLKPGMTLAVPINFKKISQQIEPFPEKTNTGSKKKIIVDLSQLAWAAYDPDGFLLRWGPLSAGKGWCPDVGRACRTPRGTFTILSKRGAQCKSSLYPVGGGGAPMPYCMFFSKNYALHGSYEVPGYHASHGCVRLFIEDAQWLNQNFVETPSTDNGYHGTSLVILP